MSIQYQSLPLDKVKDAGTRALIRQIDTHLARLFEALGAIVVTDPKRGQVRSVGRQVILKHDDNPQFRSAYGEPGELAHDGKYTMRKTGNAAEDTNWEFVGRGEYHETSCTQRTRIPPGRQILVAGGYEVEAGVELEIEAGGELVIL